MRPPDGPVSSAIVRVIVRHPWLTILTLAGVVAMGAAIVIVSGVVPIKASSGHWRITARLLDFAKLRSVATHSLGITPPDLNDEGLILRGAGHYENSCYPWPARAPKEPGVSRPLWSARPVSDRTTATTPAAPPRRHSKRRSHARVRQSTPANEISDLSRYDEAQPGSD